MTPNHGYDPTDPRAQQQTPGQQPPGQPQPPRQPQPQARQGPPRQPPQQPQQGIPPQASQHPGGQPGGQVQQTPPTGGMGVQGQTPQAAPSMAGGVGAGRQQMPQQQRQPAPRGGPTILEPITLDQLVTEDVATVQRDTPVRTAVAQMAENDIGSVVVVEDDQPVGIVTDRKVALALEDTPDVTQRQVDDFTQDDLVTADPSMNLFDALQVMSEQGIRRLPVVDENGTLQGIVTLDDAMVFLGGEFGQIAETIQEQVQPL